MTVFGLGTQDSLSQANDFHEKHDLSFEMLWDESFLSWQTIGVTSQPTAVLLQPDGTPITGWIGMFPINEVLSLAEEFSAEI